MDRIAVAHPGKQVMGCIYLITCLPTGKTYVGSTPEERARVAKNVLEGKEKAKALREKEGKGKTV